MEQSATLSIEMKATVAEKKYGSNMEEVPRTVFEKVFRQTSFANHMTRMNDFN
jgi:hypothetical protein